MGLSSSVETDILDNTFKKAEKDYHLFWTAFIGDEDSSIYPNLIAEVPGWGMPSGKLSEPTMP